MNVTTEKEMLYHFKAWRAEDPMQKEVLWSHQWYDKASIVTLVNPEKFLDGMRDLHRRAVAEKTAEALYDGWFPLDIEFWEGYNEDRFMPREYQDTYHDDRYHFVTKMTLGAPYTYPAKKMNAKDGEGLESLTLWQHAPRRLG